MSADPSGGGLGPAIADRVRPRVRLAHRASGMSGLGIIARRASGFGRTIGRAGSARARIERVDADGSGSTVRPPVIHWRGDDADDAESTAGDRRETGRLTAQPATGRPATGRPAGRTDRGTATSAVRATGAVTEPGAPIDDDVPSLGDAKVDALRRLLRTSGPPAPATPAHRAVDRPTPRETGATPTPRQAPIADPNRPDALRRDAHTTIPETATGRRDPVLPGDRRAAAPDRQVHTTTPSGHPGAPPSAAVARRAVDRSPGATAAGPRTGPGQLGRRLRPETAPPAPEVTAAPIPTAAVPSPPPARRTPAPSSTPTRGDAGWRTAAGPIAADAPRTPSAPTVGARPDLPGLPPARPTNAGPRSAADRVAALRRTVERHHSDTAPEHGRADGLDDRPGSVADPRRPAAPARRSPDGRATAARADGPSDRTAERSPERRNVPIPQGVERTGRTDLDGSAAGSPPAPRPPIATDPRGAAAPSSPVATDTRVDASAPSPEATSPVATIPRPTDMATMRPSPPVATMPRPTDVTTMRSSPPVATIRRSTDELPSVLRRGLPHSRSIGRRPLTPVTVGLLEHSAPAFEIRPPSMIESRNAPNEATSSAGADTSDRAARIAPIGPSTLVPTPPGDTGHGTSPGSVRPPSVAATEARGPLRPSPTTAPARLDGHRPLPIVNGSRQRDLVAGSESAGGRPTLEDRSAGPGTTGRPRPAQPTPPSRPAPPVLLARPGTMFAAASDPVRRSIVAPGPGALSMALSAREAQAPPIVGRQPELIAERRSAPPEEWRSAPNADATAAPAAGVQPTSVSRNPAAPRPSTRRPTHPLGRRPIRRTAAAIDVTTDPSRVARQRTDLPATAVEGAPAPADIPVSDATDALRERTDALARRFLGELSRGAPPRPTPLPAAFSPLAEAITGRRNVMVSTDAASRRALRAVGRPAATTDDVIHLEHPLGRPDRRTTELLAHELTHVAHPSPAPRFFDDDHRGPEERRAEQVARIMASSPLGNGSPAVRRSPATASATTATTGPGSSGRGSSGPASAGSSSGSITAAELAARLTGDASAARTSGPTIRRSPRGAPGATLRTTDQAASEPTIRRLTESPSSTTSSTASTASAATVGDDGGSSADIAEAVEAYLASSEGREWFRRRLTADAEVLFRALEDHIIIELERRGGRSWGTL